MFVKTIFEQYGRLCCRKYPTGRLKIFYWNELENLKSDDILLDVRRDDEFRAGKIAGAVNLPVDEIRKRLDEIPKDKNIYIYCEAGLRRYLAQRILK